MPEFRWDQSSILTICTALIAMVVMVAALKYAQSFFAPVTLGLVLAIVLSPLVRKLKRIGINPAVSAAAALMVTGVFIVFILSYLGPIITELMNQVPKIEREIQSWLAQLSFLIRGIDSIGAGIEETITEGGEEAVKAAVPGIMDALWLAPNFAAQLLILAGTLFFFLLARDDLYAKSPAQTEALRCADRSVSHYFVSIALINAGMGCVVFLVMSLIGLPNPILWGVSAFLLNFVLYLGPILMIISLLVAGFMQFTGLMIILPAFSFFLINVTEAQFVTPSLLGQHLRINPLIVFLSIVFGLWLWGPIGGIVALPVLVWVGAFIKQQMPAAGATTPARSTAA